MPTIIKNRWDNAVIYTSDTATTMRQAVLEAVAKKVDLSGSDLRGSDLRGSVLSDCVLSGSVLSGSDLRGAVGLTIEQITGKPLPVPKITNIHQAVLAAITAKGCSLNMSQWHTCETTHCRAGWVVTLAGAEGKALEERIGPAAAAMRIYLESDPNIDKLPKWHANNEDATADIIACAEREKAGTV